MRLLLDTCCLLWLVQLAPELSPRARSLITDNPGDLYVSAWSAWEIALKAGKGRLTLPLPPGQWFQESLQFHGLREIPVDSAIAVLSATLPPIHNDPSDRCIVATALLHDAVILTPDGEIAKYPGVRVAW